MPELLIETVEQGRPWKSSKGGEMQAWKVNVNDGSKSFAAEISTKVGKPGPTVGERIEATVTPSEYGPKLKRVYAENSRGGGGGKSPGERAEIRRMNAHSNAVRLLMMEHHAGLLVQGEKLGPRFLEISDWLVSDIIAAGEKAA